MTSVINDTVFVSELCSFIVNIYYEGIADGITRCDNSHLVAKRSEKRIRSLISGGKYEEDEGVEDEY